MATFHKYKSKKEGQAMFDRYGDMYHRAFHKLGSRWIIAGYSKGEWHALGDHGWVYDLSDDDVARIPTLKVPDDERGGLTTTNEPENFLVTIELGSKPETLTIIFSQDYGSVDYVENVKPKNFGSELLKLCRRWDIMPSDLHDVWGARTPEDALILSRLASMAKHGHFNGSDQ